MSGLIGRKFAALFVVATVVVVAAGCDKSSNSSTPTTPSITLRYEAGEAAVSSATARAWRSVLAAYSKATETTASAASAASDSGAGATEVLTLHAADQVSCSNAAVRYYTADGQEQAAYNPLTTARATVKGTCVVSGYAVVVDLVLDDMQASAPSVVANGTAQTVYDGRTVNAEVKAVRIPKQSCAYPTSGQIVARTTEITVTVEFNGTATAKGTYSWGGLSSSFDIPLTGCTP